ncbi:MAG: acylphosphatase [Candidatus Heimdallarchaeota archaeon]
MNNSKITQAEILVKGLVQGVSFRAYTKRKAVSLGLTGSVKNLSSGDVFVVAQGPEAKIFELIKWLRNEGSPSSDVTDVKVDWKEERDNRNFFTIDRY